MLCQRCFKKNATITISQVENNIPKEIHLCESCAQKEGIDKTLSNLPQIFTGLILDILKYKEKQAGLPVRHSESGRCPACGSSWEDFKRTGLFGCDHCYISFHNLVKELVKQIHGNTKHIGKKPRQDGQVLTEQNLQFLEKALQDAIAREEYEKAAVFRDKIRSLKQRMK